MPDDKDKKPKPQITNQHRADYNAYIDFLRSKGVAGNKVLDSNKVGKKYLADYIAANPNTSLSEDLVAPIQSDFQNYKQYALNQVRLGKAVFNSGVNADNFMQDLSSEDGWVGSRTSLHKFPTEYMRYVDLSNNTDTTVNKGFAVAQTQ
jgi:hypothetical protein